MTDNAQINSAKSRVLSIDALRGFDMFWIVGGGTIFESLDEIFKLPITGIIKRQLTHVDWEGFRFEDLIFPLFIFVVGLVLPYSLSRRLEAGHSRSRIFMQILKRTVLLIVLGLFYYNGHLHFHLDKIRWMGVLQRIGICYFFAAILVMNTKWRTQVVVAGAILLSYWLALMLIPVPGFGAGNISPEGCLPSYIDQLLLPGRLCCYGYGENEGILSTLPAICTAIIGALAGQWLRSPASGNRKTIGLAVAGLISLLAGYGWGQTFPVIKNIWTSSFVLVTAGWSMLLLALFYWVIDVKGLKKWAFFFIVIGVNAITIYFLSQFINFTNVADFFIGAITDRSGQFKPLVSACGTMIAEWLFLWFLYRKKIFLKV